MSAAPLPQEPEAPELASPPRRPRPVSAPEPGQSPFRRPGVVQRHRRKRRLLGVLKLMAMAVFLVGAPVALGLWALTTPQLEIQRLEIQAAERVSQAWVERELSPLLGQNLLRVSMDDVRNRLHRHPWVEGASIRKTLPHGLHVDVIQREPQAVLSVGDELSFVDGEGHIIAPVGSEEVVSGLPVLTGVESIPEDVRKALEVSLEPARLEQPWAASLQRVEILGEEDFRLIFADLPFPLLVRFGSLEDKERHLERVLPEIASRYRHVKALDLRYARRIVLQPDGDGDVEAPQSHPSRG